MKKAIQYVILSAGLLAMTGDVNAQDESGETGLAGDGFSLEGAISLFSTVKNVEAFEQALNAADNGINNLDLNQDGNTDYVTAEEISDGDSRAVILRVPVNEKESQDIAVIEIEKTGEKSATLQIVGDEELYGENVISEPSDEKYFGGKGGPSVPDDYAIVIVNVWFWPCVVTMYGPMYNPWISPYGWAYYPGWWRPYRVHPFAWHYHYCAPFRSRCSRATVIHAGHIHGIYRGRRHSSVHVHNHYKSAHEKKQSGKSNMKSDSEMKTGEKSSAKKVNKGTKVNPSDGTVKPNKAKQSKNVRPSQSAKPGVKQGERKPSGSKNPKGASQKAVGAPKGGKKK